MFNSLPVFFDHSRHKLWVRNLDAHLDVLAFNGEEHLSQPFSYRVEFTSTEQDLAAEKLLGQDARFSLHAAPLKLPVMSWAPPPAIKPLRTLNGVITAFKRLSASPDEARYELTLQPRLALLGRGRQYRIYQHQSVPEIVESILRGRHEFEGHDFQFRLVREYPKREQVMQYAESDLAFITRLLADVGIWYRFTSDQRLNIDVVEFCDDQRGYQFGIELPHRPPGGFSSGEEGVWQLQSSHQVVEKNLHLRAYDPRNAHAWLQSDVDQTRGAKTTYGEAYHYAEPYTQLGDAYAQDEDLQSESGYFYARLRHERYLNEQTRLSGICSSATLAPGQVLTITGGAPQAFAPRAVITHLTTRAARDASFECSFEAIPYAETICFRPKIPPKPQISGTLPARVSSSQAHDLYADINKEGRYRVNFLFDRDEWKLGKESLWLRLARPYAGDTHGLHLPLIQGTEVAIAFEQGDPDRPYIAHALHDDRHPDHVTLAKRDYTRNVLRTPANNKLRMEDRRGQEHVKLSTEYGGKSQLNLGHLVDAEKRKRGEGFELRTDEWLRWASLIWCLGRTVTWAGPMAIRSCPVAAWSSAVCTWWPAMSSDCVFRWSRSGEKVVGTRSIVKRWITAWRIDRYAFTSLKQTAFYLQASDTEADPALRKDAKEERDKKQVAVEKRRREQLAREGGGRTPKKPLEPGIKDFDADMAQTQLREAAEEFAAAYQDPDHLASSLSRVLPANVPPEVVLRIITADARVECRQMKAAGRARVSQLFPPPDRQRNHWDEKHRRNVDESRNANQPIGLLRALFDDQVHDSRAWFLYSFGRELMGSYFRERMVFFGEASRRELAMSPDAQAELLARGTPLPVAPSIAARPAVMDAQRMAEAQRKIDALWDAYDSKVGEVGDAQV